MNESNVTPTPDSPRRDTGQGEKPGLGAAMGTAGGLPPAPPADVPNLERQLAKPRTLFSAGLSVITGLMALIAMVPLFSVLFRLIYEGGRRLSPWLFVELPPAAGMDGGGIGNALLGTLLMVAIATVISVPFGIIAAVFIGELDPRCRTAELVRFCAKVLTGLPSVLAGLFAYAVVVLMTGRYSAVAGGFALSILMLPTVLLTAEQAIKMVPARMREAAIGMGATRTQVVWHITLPTAMPGILTGVMLAVARAAGETAPLLFTALFFDYWTQINPRNPAAALMEPTASLAVLIYDFAQSPFKNQVEIAWSASLVLVCLVLVANIAAQVYSHRQVK
jgi:phosphate transport system permease protein